MHHFKSEHPDAKVSINFACSCVGYTTKRIIIDMHEAIREIIREILAEEQLEEFSGAGAVAGFSLPLGMSPKPKRRSKKKRKMNENTRGSIYGFDTHTLHNVFRYTVIDDLYHENECDYYFDGLYSLSKSFGGAENPFGDGETGRKNSEKYLKGQINYPHKF